MTLTPEQIKQTVAEIRAQHDRDEDYMQDGGSVFNDLDNEKLFMGRAALLKIADHLQKTIEVQAAEAAKSAALLTYHGITLPAEQEATRRHNYDTYIAGSDETWGEYCLRFPLPWEKVK